VQCNVGLTAQLVLDGIIGIAASSGNLGSISVEATKLGEVVDERMLSAKGRCGFVLLLLALLRCFRQVPARKKQD
jgi:hypothetical protein